MGFIDWAIPIVGALVFLTIIEGINPQFAMATVSLILIALALKDPSFIRQLGSIMRGVQGG